VTRLPDPTQQTPAPQAGQPTLNPAAIDFLHDVEDALARASNPEQPPAPTSYRDNTPTPAIGTTPPIAQPGRPPMSQRATDLNTTILSSSVLTAVLGGSATGIIWASGQANPTVIACICAGAVAVPAALALPVLALKSLMKNAKEVAQAAPPTINNHYTGTFTQTNNTINADTRGLIATSRNQIPPAR
jgi:hypothetical protein